MISKFRQRHKERQAINGELREDKAKKKDEHKGSYLRRLKDYSLLMEYKKLGELAPTGVYVVPSPDSIRVWNGVIFLRRSLYQHAAFKFRIQIPDSYPEHRPSVFFENMLIEDQPYCVYHPLIDPKTGELDLSVEFSNWHSSQHYIVFVLAYIKKAFYKDAWWVRPGVKAFNTDAQQCWVNNKERFLTFVKLCVRASQKAIHFGNENSNLKFPSTPSPAIKDILSRVKSKKQMPEEGGSFLPWFQEGEQKLQGHSTTRQEKSKR